MGSKPQAGKKRGPVWGQALGRSPWWGALWRVAWTAGEELGQGCTT